MREKACRRSYPGHQNEAAETLMLWRPIEDPKSALAGILLRGADRISWKTWPGNCSRGVQDAKMEPGL